MKKSALVILCFISMVVVSLAFIKPKPARYENLKVLPKNTNKHQMDSVMKHFTTSLGVKCNFCHVRNNDEKKDWNFASDENKHKGQARDMMRMTAKVNKKFFGDETNAITCFTCHAGHEEPTSFPPLKKEVTGSH